jgi:hypothetical protein
VVLEWLAGRPVATLLSKGKHGSGNGCRNLTKLKERKMLYEAFDRFLSVDTWHTRHPSDEERFFIALKMVVTDLTFNPDNMGEYFRQKKKVSRDDEEHPFNYSIDHYVAAAWAVKDYLKANKL